MKILLISSSSGSHGGGEFYLLTLAEGLRAMEHDVRIWMSEHPQMDPLAEAFLRQQVPVERICYRNTYHRKTRCFGAFFDRPLQKALSRRMRDSGVDLIHVNQQCLEDGLDLIVAAGQSKLPAVSTIHVTRSAASLKAHGAWLRDSLSRYVLRRSHVPLIGISPTSAADLAHFLHGPAGHVQETDVTTIQSEPPVYSVANGVSSPQLADRARQREGLGLSSGDFILGVIARIEEQKNPLFMCRLLKQLPEHVKCVWVGDGRLREQFETEIRKTGLESRVILTGWRDSASQCLSAFDCFCLPSHYEGMPLALLEAMAASLPCVASRVDGTQDAIQHGRDGYLCSVDDVGQWLHALLPLIESPGLRSTIGQAAHARYKAEFSIEAMTKRTVAVYEEVIGK